MPVQKLDAALVALAHCPNGVKKIEYRDTSIVGFSLEVRASGGKTYYLRYFDQGGRQRQLKIGGHADISFDQARKAARRLRSEVVLGGDPSGDKEQHRAVPTYASLAQQHIDHAKTYQRSWWSTEGIIRNHIVPRWGRLRLDEIHPQDVAKWLADKSAEGLKPATVEKIRVVFGRSFELARQWSITGAKDNPARGLQRPKFDNKRERFLTAEQAARLLRATEASLNTQLKGIVCMLLLTGARVSELLHARWEHVDLGRRSWRIPQSKTGLSRNVPLAQAAVDVIEQLPRFDGCPYLLPNPETLKPFVSIKRAWHTARKKAGLPDFRLHDARHSSASFMINAGIDLFTVGRILGHADHQSTMRYAHLANDTLLAAVEAGAAKMTLGASPQT